MKPSRLLQIVWVLPCLLPVAAEAEKLQLDATATSFFDDFVIVFEDTGDGLLQHGEILFFGGTAGTPPGATSEVAYSGISHVPDIPGVSTASGTVNPEFPSPGWGFVPSAFGSVSDGWSASRWTYVVSPYITPSQTMRFSYTFDGTADGNPWSPGAELSGTITGTLMPDSDTVIIDSFGTVTLARPGLALFVYAAIDESEFNAFPVTAGPARMSVTGVNNRFRACPEGFDLASQTDCGFSDSPGGGFLIGIGPLGVFYATAADGSGASTLCGSGDTQAGCRVTDWPFNPANWSLSIDVPADGCTVESGGCNPTGLHEIVLPDGFVVPPGGTISQTAMSFVDPRADENGRCDGQTPLILLDGDVIIPPYLCGSPEFMGILTEANFDITEGTLSHAVFPENFVSNPFECTLPIVGDPQLQSAFVWQPTDSADVIEGSAIELTNDCGSSRGKTRGLSYFFVGLHIDFGLDFDADPRPVTQAFADLTTTKLNSLVIAVVHARPALKSTYFLKLFLLARTAEVLHRHGKYIAARRILATFIHLTERTPFNERVGNNHEGNLLSRADNIRFLLDEFVLPVAR